MAMDLRSRNGKGKVKTMGDLQSRLDEFKKAFLNTLKTLKE